MGKKMIIITGPSGAGKSTLLSNINKECKIGIPRQTTTRKPRIDDNQKYYRYVNIETFQKMHEQKKFAISSGRNERSYGILKYDIMEALNTNDTIVIITSYKNIEKIQKINIDLHIIVLTFNNHIEEWVKRRIQERERGNSSPEDIKIRSEYAKLEHKQYFEKIKKIADVVVYTDLYNIRQTINIVKQRLQLTEKMNCISKER